MQKDNRIHRLLGILIKRMELNAYRCVFDDVKINIQPWHRRIFNRIFRRHVSIYEVRYLIEQLRADGVYLGLVQEFECGFSAEDLYRIRNFYYSKNYKEPIKWWIISIQIFAVGASIATVIGVLDSRQTPDLKNKILQQQTQIESLTNRIAKDSIVLDSIRDWIETLKKEKPDSLFKVNN
jgi:hypothetical protein